MDTNRHFCLMLGVCAVLLTSGCASVVSGRRADVAFNSNPPNAAVSVRDRDGAEVATARTPGVVSLNRGRGFFKPARYTATIEKPGYQPAQVEIGTKLNPWLLGNVLLGGVIGLVVDPYTGAMWSLTPGEINQDLTPVAQADATYQADARAQPASTQQMPPK